MRRRHYPPRDRLPWQFDIDSLLFWLFVALTVTLVIVFIIKRT